MVVKKVILLILGVLLHTISYGQNTKIRLFVQTTGFDSIVAKNDSLIFYNQDVTYRAFMPDLDSTNEIIDSVTFANDTLRIYQGEDTAVVRIVAADADWYRIGTSSAPTSINDSIYTGGDIRLTNYTETRADDTSSYLNTLYTDALGNVKSGRREIIPPSVAIDVTLTGTNTFNYYNHYATQMTNAGLTPVPLANLDFYVMYFDTGVFSTATINASGVLSYTVVSPTTDYAVIDVRFYTK